MATKKDANFGTRLIIWLFAYIAASFVILRVLDFGDWGDMFAMAGTGLVMIQVCGLFKRVVCSDCGNRVESESKFCPTCRSHFPETDKKP